MSRFLVLPILIGLCAALVACAESINPNELPATIILAVTTSGPVDHTKVDVYLPADATGAYGNPIYTQTQAAFDNDTLTTTFAPGTQVVVVVSVYNDANRIMGTGSQSATLQSGPNTFTFQIAVSTTPLGPLDANTVITATTNEVCRVDSITIDVGNARCDGLGYPVNAVVAVSNPDAPAAGCDVWVAGDSLGATDVQPSNPWSGVSGFTYSFVYVSSGSSFDLQLFALDPGVNNPRQGGGVIANIDCIGGPGGLAQAQAPVNIMVPDFVQGPSNWGVGAYEQGSNTLRIAEFGYDINHPTSFSVPLDGSTTFTNMDLASLVNTGADQWTATLVDDTTGQLFERVLTFGP